MDPLALVFITITVLWFGIAVFISPLIAAILLLAVSDGQRLRPSN